MLFTSKGVRRDGTGRDVDDDCLARCQTGRVTVGRGGATTLNHKILSRSSSGRDSNERTFDIEGMLVTVSPASCYGPVDAGLEGVR